MLAATLLRRHAKLSFAKRTIFESSHNVMHVLYIWRASVGIGCPIIVVSWNVVVERDVLIWEGMQLTLRA